MEVAKSAPPKKQLPKQLAASANKSLRAEQKKYTASTGSMPLSNESVSAASSSMISQSMRRASIGVLPNESHILSKDGDVFVPIPKRRLSIPVGISSGSGMSEDATGNIVIPAAVSPATGHPVLQRDSTQVTAPQVPNAVGRGDKIAEDAPEMEQHDAVPNFIINSVVHAPVGDSSVAAKKAANKMKQFKSLKQISAQKSQRNVDHGDEEFFSKRISTSSIDPSANDKIFHHTIHCLIQCIYNVRQVREQII